MSTIYLICRTTGYGNFHTPIYLETSSEEAEKMKKHLQRLYDELRKAKKQSISECYVASVWKIELSDSRYYRVSDKLSYVYKRYPLYCVTNLNDSLELYADNDKERCYRNHEEDRKRFDWYRNGDYKPFRLDFNGEVKAIHDEIEKYDDDEFF